MVKTKIKVDVAEMHLMELVDSKWYTHKYNKDINNNFQLIMDLKGLLPENKVFFKNVENPKDINKNIERAMIYWLENSEYKADLRMITKLLNTKRKKVIKHLIDNYDVNDRIVNKRGIEKDSIAIYCIKNNIYSEDIFQREDFDLNKYNEKTVFSIVSEIVFNNQRKKDHKYLLNDLPELFDRIKNIASVKENGVYVFKDFFLLSNFRKQKWNEAFLLLRGEDLDIHKDAELLKELEPCCVFIDFLTNNCLTISENSNVFYQRDLEKFNQSLIEYHDFNEMQKMKNDLKNNNNNKDSSNVKRKLNKF